MTTTKKIAITHRWTGAVLFAAEVPADDLFPMRSPPSAPIAAGADLAGANLVATHESVYDHENDQRDADVGGES